MESNDIIKYIAGLNHSIDELEGAVQPLVAKLLDELLAQYGHLKEETLAKINTLNNYAYTLISVLFSRLKAQGVDTDAHPIKAELERIQGYMKRAKTAASKQQLEEEADKKRQQQAKDYIQQTLGVKSGDLAPQLLAEPAISTGNFDLTKSQSPEQEQEQVSLELTAKAAELSKQTKSKVTKPKHNRNRKRK